MAGLSTREMIGYISNFVSEMHDYNPIPDIGYTGCYNTKYHGNLCQAIVHPPLTVDNDTSYPTKIIAYILTNNGNIVVCDENLNGYNLLECLGESVESVYNNISEASEIRRMYEENMKGEA